MPELSAAHAALLMAGLQECLLALGWLITGLLLPDVRRAVWHWGGYALLSGASFLVYVVGASWHGDAMRFMGNLLLISAMLLQSRGLYLFAGYKPPDRVYVALVSVTLLALLGWSSAEQAPWRIAAVSTILCGIEFWSAAVMVRRVRMEIPGWRAFLFGLPVAVGSVVLGVRTLAVLLDADGVVQATLQGSSISLGAAVAWLVLSLSFEMTLLGLLMFRFGSELSRAARQDALTGLMNRRAVDEAMIETAHHAMRFGRPFSVLMIDIDHFKAINDRLGHVAGDHVLKALATLLRGRVRVTDRVARWGGEEFLVLLPETGEAGAAQLAEELRQAVATAGIQWQQRPVPLAVSLGVATWRQGAGPAADVIACADEALYRAKREGRDRVCIGALEARAQRAV